VHLNTFYLQLFLVENSGFFIKNSKELLKVNRGASLMISIRRAMIPDAEILAQNNLCLAQESEHITLDYETTLAGIRTLIQDKTKGFFLVAEKQGIIIGQMMITSEWSDWRNTSIWWLQSVYVHPEWRKQGVFTLMLKHVTQEARAHDVDVLRLYTHTDNDTAQQVYRQSGMKQQPYTIYEIPTGK
jgi:GNAT superfamily N-acetyltransferase